MSDDLILIDSPTYLAVDPVEQTTMEILDTGAPGPTGPKGDAGSPSYFTQASAAATWTIAHNLGHNPVISTHSVGGVAMMGTITHLSVNVAQIDFNAPVAGTATLF